MKENKNTQSVTDLGQRQALKEQLGQWKKEKEEAKIKEKEDQKKREEQAKTMLRAKMDEERKWKKEQVEDFKFRKEMER